MKIRFRWYILFSILIFLILILSDIRSMQNVNNQIGSKDPYLNLYGNCFHATGIEVLNKIKTTTEKLRNEKVKFKIAINHNGDTNKVFPEQLSINNLIDTFILKEDNTIIDLEINIRKRGFVGELTGFGKTLSPRFKNGEKFITESGFQKELDYRVNYAIVDVINVYNKEQILYRNILYTNVVCVLDQNSSIKFTLLQQLPEEYRKRRHIIEWVKSNKTKNFNCKKFLKSY